MVYAYLDLLPISSVNWFKLPSAPSFYPLHGILFLDRMLAQLVEELAQFVRQHVCTIPPCFSDRERLVDGAGRRGGDVGRGHADGMRDPQ